MLGRSKLAVMGAMGAMASVGATIGRSLRDAGAQVINLPSAPRLSENGMPVHERTPRKAGKTAISVAQGKRAAAKARNRARNKTAHRKPRP